MVRLNEVRIRTPWSDRLTCPRDIKPDRGLFKPLAPAEAGDFRVGDEP